MEKIIGEVPVWALCCIINSDRTDLTDREVEMIDNWIKSENIRSVVPLYDINGEEMEIYFSYYPPFGPSTDVVMCEILFEIDNE